MVEWCNSVCSVAVFLVFILVALLDILFMSNILYVPVWRSFDPCPSADGLLNVSEPCFHAKRQGASHGVGHWVFFHLSDVTQAPAIRQSVRFIVSPTVGRSVMAMSTNLPKLYYVSLVLCCGKRVKSPLNKSAIFRQPTVRSS